MSVAESIFYTLPRRAVGVVGMAAQGTVKALMHWWGAIPAIGIFALLSEWDHKHEKSRIKEEFESEIAARLGKKPEFVTANDMEEVAAENPTIESALKRSRWKRNLNIAVISVCMFAAIGLGMWAGPLIAAKLFAGSELATLITTGITGFLSFTTSERILENIAKRQFKLNEPELGTVERDPERQSELSLPRQIRFLSRLQSRRVVISQEQVFNTFVAANPDLAERIQSTYGAPFAALPADKKVEAIEALGPRVGLEQITEDINNRLVRAQELAFAVYGQHSGVPKLEAPKVTVLEKAQEKMGELGEQVKGGAAYVGGKVKDGASVVLKKSGAAAAAVGRKLGIGRSQVEGVVPENQEKAEEVLQAGGVPLLAENAAASEVPAPTAPGFVARCAPSKPFNPAEIAEERLRQPSMKPENIIAGKQQSAEAAAAV